MLFVGGLPRLYLGAIVRLHAVSGMFLTVWRFTRLTARSGGGGRVSPVAVVVARLVSLSRLGGSSVVVGFEHCVEHVVFV